MRKAAINIVLGLSVIAGSLALATPASAQSSFNRWRNRNDTNGTFFMGVSGGLTCLPRMACKLPPDKPIIIWTQDQNDQLWLTPPSGNTTVVNFALDTNNNNVCLAAPNTNGNSGGQLSAKACNGTGLQFWEKRTAESLGAPFAGCFIFRNTFTGQVAGVSGANMNRGTAVIQWPLFLGANNSEIGWHKDQFWCPA